MTMQLISSTVPPVVPVVVPDAESLVATGSAPVEVSAPSSSPQAAIAMVVSTPAPSASTRRRSTMVARSNVRPRSKVS